MLAYRVVVILQDSLKSDQVSDMDECVSVGARARARACVCVCVRVCVYECVTMKKSARRMALRSVKACPEISAIRNVWAAASRAIVQ